MKILAFDLTGVTGIQKGVTDLSNEGRVLNTRISCNSRFPTASWNRLGTGHLTCEQWFHSHTKTVIRTRWWPWCVIVIQWSNWQQGVFNCFSGSECLLISAYYGGRLCTAMKPYEIAIFFCLSVACLALRSRDGPNRAWFEHRHLFRLLFSKTIWSRQRNRNKLLTITYQDVPNVTYCAWNSFITQLRLKSMQKKN